MKQNRMYTQVTFYTMEEGLDKLIKTILTNLGSSLNAENMNVSILEAIEFVNSHNLSFKDFVNWSELSKSQYELIEDDMEMFLQKDELINISLAKCKGLTTGEWYLLFCFDGENDFNWKIISEQNPQMDIIVDEYFITKSEGIVFKGCTLYEEVVNGISEETFDSKDIEKLILKHPIHYGMIRINELQVQMEELGHDKHILMEKCENIYEDESYNVCLSTKIKFLENVIQSKGKEIGNIHILWDILKENEGSDFEDEADEDSDWLMRYRKIDNLTPLSCKDE